MEIKIWSELESIYMSERRDNKINCEKKTTRMKSNFEKCFRNNLLPAVGFHFQ